MIFENYNHKIFIYINGIVVMLKKFSSVKDTYRSIYKQNEMMPNICF